MVDLTKKKTLGEYETGALAGGDTVVTYRSTNAVGEKVFRGDIVTGTAASIDEGTDTALKMYSDAELKAAIDSLIETAVPDGTEAQIVAGTDTTERKYTPSDLSGATKKIAVAQYDSIADIEALTADYDGQAIYLSAGGRSGTFIWDSSDLSANVTIDTLKGVYIAPSGEDGSNGAWVRELNGYVTPEMFGGDSSAARIFSNEESVNIEFRDDTTNQTLYPYGYSLSGKLTSTNSTQAVRPANSGGDTGLSEFTRIHDMVLNSSSVGIANNGISEFDITDSVVQSSGYGVLINESADMSGSIIANSRIISLNSDAVEYNTTDGNVSSVVNNGLILEAGLSGSGSTSGFSLGYAKTKTVALAGNVSSGSRNEALHIEDLCERFTASAQSYADCGGDGVRILADSGTDIPSYAFSAIVAEKTKTDGVNWDKTNIGWHQVWDGNGTIPGIPVSAVTMVGFNTGFKFGDAGGQVVGPLSSFGCTYGIEQSKKSAVYGLVRVDDADYVVKSGSGNIYPNVSMGENVGDIVNRSSLDSSRVGATFRGLSGSTYATFAGGSAYTYVPILPAKSVDIASGKLVCICDMEENGGFVYSLDFEWNGSTFTLIDHNNRGFGTKGTSTPRVDSDNLEIRIFNASSVTHSGTVRWFFDGHITLGGE